MIKYRNALPQLGKELFLTDGGIETTLIFQDGLELPYFAAFPLLNTTEGETRLRSYYSRYATIAKRFGAGFIFESPTWRANEDWGVCLGYTPVMLADANRKAIALMESVRNEYETEQSHFVISGCIGPRGDGYVPDKAMSVEQAEAYHLTQIKTFAGTVADMVCAVTMNYVEEAVGVVRAAQQAGMPVAVSFTVETDGLLPTGQTLQGAIEQVDGATADYPSYYMLNCAHPTHFEHVVSGGGRWLERIRGLRANASRQSHAELNEAPELDAGNPVELGMQYAGLRKSLIRLNVMGGCCGTDHRHVEQIAKACTTLFSANA